MRKKHKIRSGLTLVELVIAFSTAVIVFFAISSIMVFGQRSLNYGLLQANLQRDVALAQLKIKQSIRGAKNAALDDDGNGVKIFHAAGWIRFWWLPGSQNLLYQLEDEDQHVLLEGIVEQADFDVDGCKVTVALETRQGNCRADFITTTTMRNYAAGP
jgi:hypothetical protein